MKATKTARKHSAAWRLGMSLAGLLPAVAGMASAPSHEEWEAGTIRIDSSRPVIRLEASAARLDRVLDALSAQLKTPIRYSNAHEQPVTVTCRSERLEKVLRCLLGAEADLVFQYAGAGGRQSGGRRIASVTVLASTFTDLAHPGAAHPANDRTPDPQKEPAGQDPDSLPRVLAMTRSDDPEQRAMALERLRRVEGVDDDTLQAAYQNALSDADGDVRAEAVSGLALLNAGDNLPLLTSALADEHPSVRLAALDSLEVTPESRPYYNEALNDPDESVRELAALRLGIE